MQHLFLASQVNYVCKYSKKSYNNSHENKTQTIFVVQFEDIVYHTVLNQANIISLTY